VEGDGDQGAGGQGDRWRRLEVWRRADDFALEVYRATAGFPREEQFGLTSQLRRAALSVPTNVVEGYSRRGDRELARFLDIALGSLGETKYLLHFAMRLTYLEDPAASTLQREAEEIGAMLWALTQRVRGGR